MCTRAIRSTPRRFARPPHAGERKSEPSATSVAIPPRVSMAASRARSKRAAPATPAHPHGPQRSPPRADPRPPQRPRAAGPQKPQNARGLRAPRTTALPSQLTTVPGRPNTPPTNVRGGRGPTNRGTLNGHQRSGADLTPHRPTFVGGGAPRTIKRSWAPGPTNHGKRAGRHEADPLEAVPYRVSRR